MTIPTRPSCPHCAAQVDAAEADRRRHAATADALYASVFALIDRADQQAAAIVGAGEGRQ